MKYYTVYLKENDEIVVFGTAKECAKILNISLNHFHSIVSKTCKGKRNKYEILIEDINPDEHAELMENEK